MRVHRIGFVGSYPPRRCGIATFSADLINSTAAAGGESFQPVVVAVETDSLDYDSRVEGRIRRDTRRDYVDAAELINTTGISAVVLQHEFGLFGGLAGNYINLFLERLSSPVVTCLHTVLRDPEPHYREQMDKIIAYSDKLVVVSRPSLELLQEVHGVPEDKIVHLPHGLPDLEFGDTGPHKRTLGYGDKLLVLTFGLLSRGKGIHVALEGLPTAVKRVPNLLYAVVGVTHPEVRKREGEEYRLALQRQVRKLHLEGNVLFVDRFLSDQELGTYLSAADIYLTPYLGENQVSSGTLSFAVGAGKPVISTPYEHARELLADGRGVLVPTGDPAALGRELLRLAIDPAKRLAIGKKAYEFAREMTWSKIGCRYWDLLSSYDPTKIAGDKLLGVPVVREVPNADLTHLRRLSDDTGVLQHAVYLIPNRRHGYCTDDNARALEAVALYDHQHAAGRGSELLDLFLSFLVHAQSETGEFRNFMTYDRRFAEGLDSSGDSFGRSFRALATLVAHPLLDRYAVCAQQMLELALPRLSGKNLRNCAHAAVGLARWFTRDEGRQDLRDSLTGIADQLAAAYARTSGEGWRWFEDILSYDNGVLPQALFAISMALGVTTYLDVAREACDFLVDVSRHDRVFSFVGSDGWYPRGGRKAAFDQQPIEAGSVVQMLGSAYRATGDRRYLDLQRDAFSWFLGVNDAQSTLYDFGIRGCADALTPSGASRNMGGESQVCYLLALLSVSESSTASALQPDLPFTP